jgi:hypothetical protein
MALIACLLAAGPAFAATVTLDGAALANFAELTSSGTYGTFLRDTGTSYASLTTLWQFNSATWGWATVGASNSVGWTGADTLSLAITNDDESQWFFRLFASQGATKNESALVGLLPGQTAVFSVALSGLSLPGSLSIGIYVESTQPWSHTGASLDRVAEYTVASSAPVPPALWLLGGGLSGLMLVRRRFRK